MPIDDALADIGAALNAGNGATPAPAPGAANGPAAPPTSGVDAALADLRNISAGDGTFLSSDSDKTGGIARNVAAGGNVALANNLGMPVDAMTWAVNKGVEGVNALAGTQIPEITSPVGGSDSIKSAMGVVGADPRDVGANDIGDRLARGIGSGLVSMVAPTAAARSVAAGMAPGIAQGVMQSLGDVGLPTAATVGAAGGAGGSAAAEAVPDQYKPLAEAGGQLVAGGAVGGAAAGIRALADLGISGARDLAGPFIPSVAKNIAAEKLTSAASDPQNLAATLANEPKAPLVPGSNPTTFQATGDSGIGQLERAARTQNPAPFLDQAADQNAARVGAVQSLAPENANPSAVGNLFRQQLGAIDQAGDNNVRLAQQNADQTFAAAGGTQSPDAYGGMLRDQMEAAKSATKQQESKLWQAIDPDGTLTINASPVVQAASDIASQIPKTALPPQGEEAAILNASQQMGGSPQSFSDFAALRSRLNTAIRQEVGTNGQSPAWRRMVMLRGSMDDTMANAADGVAQQQTQAVAAGTMSPDATFEYRLLGDRSRWYADRNGAAAASAAGQGGGNPGAGSLGNAGGGPTAVPGPPRAESPAGSGLAADQGLPSLSSQAPVAPTFDADAAARYRAAADATKARAQTFNNPVVGPALQERGGFNRIPDTAVPQRFMAPGPAAQSFLDAGAQPQTMQDALVADLRQSATNSDGTLNTGKYQTWLRNRSDALQPFPDLQQRLGTAASAQGAVDDAAASAKTQTDAYRQSAARYFLGAEPRQAVASAFGSRTPAADFTQLSSLVAGDADAKAGLQKAVVDHMLGATQSNRPAGDTGIGELNPDAFQKYLARNRQPLAAVFTPDQLDSMDAVATDLRRSTLSSNASKIAGSPGTAQDLASVLAGVKTSMLGNIVRRAAGGFGGYLLGGLHGAIEGVMGGEAANAIRRAGLDQVNKLVEAALLDPSLARSLLQNYTPRTSVPLADQLRSNVGGSSLAALLAAPQRSGNSSAQTSSPLARAIASGPASNYASAP